METDTQNTSISKKENKYNMLIRLIITYILNIIDLILTRYFINKGFNELNPFARFLINHNLDWIFKIVIIGIILFYFWKKRDISASTLASWISLGVYTFMTIWWAIQIIVFIKYK